MTRAAAVPAIGVLSPLVSGFYFGGILDGIARAAAESGYTTMAFQCQPAGTNTAEQPAFPYEMLRPVGWARAEGFISLVSAASDASLRSIHDAGKALVLVSYEVPGLHVPTVVPDNTTGVQAAVQHLIEHGHQRIAFAGMMAQPDIRERFAAYRSTLIANGIEPDPRLLYETGDPIVSGGEHAAAAMLAAGLPSTAVVVGTDLNALGIMRALSAAGLALPAQQAIVGFDDIEDGAYTRPTLSSVASDFTGIGRLAFELLLGQLRGETVEPGNHQHTTRFVARQSCGCTGAQPVPLEPPALPGTDALTAPLCAALLGRAAPEYDWEVASTDGSAALAAYAQAFTECLTSAEVVTASTLRGSSEHLWPVVRGLGDLSEITDLLRAGARDWLAATGHSADQTRLERLLLETSMVLSAEKSREQFDRRTMLLSSLTTQYALGMDLLRSHQQDPAALTWLGRTAVLAGVLALYGGEGSAESRTMTIRGVYDPADELSGLVGEPIDEPEFPPAALLRAAAAHHGNVVVVLPVTSGGRAQGLLATVAPVVMRDATGRETFNQWAALLAVALDHQQLLTSLREQQTSIAQSLDREHELADDIRRSEQRYALAAAAANDGLWDWDLTDGSVYYSDRGASVLGSAHAHLGTGIDAWLNRVHPDDRRGLDAAINRQRAGADEPMEHEHRVRTDGGEIRWVLGRGLAVTDDAGTVVRIVGSFTDITDRRELEDRLRHQALYDNLTTLPNRALFLDRLGVAMRRRVRHPGHRFAVLFIDLDGFKVINDSLGHVTGDKLLVSVAQRLLSFVRTGDTAARIGGDEFVVLLDDLSPSADVPSVTERLQDMLAVPCEIDGHRVVVTASIGIATPAEEHESPEDMLRDADIAMYRAKTSQRGGQATFDATMRASLVNRMSIETQLRSAVDEGAFALHYQPIVALESGQITGFEALIRWPVLREGRHLLVPPAEFLPVAEETGLIVAIGRWVIEETCRQVAGWRAAGHPAGRLPISVNVSNQEFWHTGLLGHLDSNLAAAGLEPQALALEITEGVIMHNAARAEALLDEMHQRGLPVHIDDFGTGYSSLEALHRFRLDALKIDRSFVVAMSGGQRSAELVRTIIAMGESLGLGVIAEGIEEQGQSRMLQRFGCALGQGYLFSRPLPAEQIGGLFAAGRPVPAGMG